MLLRIILVITCVPFLRFTLSVFCNNRKPRVMRRFRAGTTTYGVRSASTVPYPGINGSFPDLYAPCPACCFVPFYGIYPETGKSCKVAQRIFPVARARQTGENRQNRSRRRCVKSEKAAGVNPARFRYASLMSLSFSVAMFSLSKYEAQCFIYLIP